MFWEKKRGDKMKVYSRFMAWRNLLLLLASFFFFLHSISSLLLFFCHSCPLAGELAALGRGRGEGKRFSDLEATSAQESNKLRPLRFRPLPLYEKRMRVRAESETKELFLDQTFFFTGHLLKGELLLHWT